MFTQHPSCLLVSVIVNFMCQLDKATGCPDIWLNKILSVSVSGFPEDISV